MPQKVFISYARENESFCHQLAGAFQKEDFSVWMDVESIRAGVDWAKNILDAINGCDFLIAVHSESSLGRSYQAKGEWLHAVDLGKRVFPIIIESGVRPHRVLAHLQAVDFSRPGTFDDHFQKLKDALVGDENYSSTRNTYRFEFGDQVFQYPDFGDGYAKNYSELINHATEINCMVGVGRRFIIQHDAAIIRRLMSGAKLRYLVARPTECNLHVIASWSSAETRDLRYLTERVRDQGKQMAETLIRITKYAPKAEIELRLMETPPSLTTFQFNAESHDGVIIVTLYPLGPSIHPFLRPTTTLRRDIFPDLYDHFRLMFNNAWESAETISIEAFFKVLSENELP